MDEPLIRDALPTDAENLLNIYRPFIEDTAVSFETTIPSTTEFEDRVIDTLLKFPWLVYEIGGRIAGYAYAGPHRSRCAYNWSVEATVYIDVKFRRQGIGTALYTELFELLIKQGAVNVFAGITLPNPGSIGLHESLGFSQIGVYKNIGYKHAKWWDVGWWQLSLQSPKNPKQLTPYPLI